jgi:hypothetical protein
MPSHDIGRVSVVFEGSTVELSPGDAVTFGRHGDVVIDPDNRMLHRVLGRVWNDDTAWWLSNLGTSIALVVSDLDGASFARITPGGSIPLPFARSAVAFSAGRANYRLTLDLIGRTPVAGEAVDVVSADRTVTASSLLFNDDQQALLAALVRHRRSASPTSSGTVTRDELARELGWSPAKLGRKLDHLCIKLARVGVQGLVGREGRHAMHRQQVLADTAVELGLIRPEPPGRPTR